MASTNLLLVPVLNKPLPKGDQPFQLYTLPTPNGIKATIMLEELKELGVTQAGL